jgi:quinol monooxygenase YgiN
MLVFLMKVRTHSDKREEFLQTIRLLDGGVVNKNGHLSHDWYQAIEDSNRFILVERWANHDAMREHHRLEQFRILLGAVRTLGELLDQSTSAFFPEKGTKLSSLHGSEPHAPFQYGPHPTRARSEAPIRGAKENKGFRRKV